MNECLRLAVIGYLLVGVIGCGNEGGAAGTDFAAQAQTQSDAKNAMESSSKKRSDGKPTKGTKGTTDSKVGK